jgi:hypothetical protein
VPPVPQHAERDLQQSDLPPFFRAIRSRHHRDPARADRVAVQRRDDELRRLLEAVQRLVGVEAEV